MSSRGSYGKVWRRTKPLKGEMLARYLERHAQQERSSHHQPLIMNRHERRRAARIGKAVQP
jgi:hypothetical protein